MQNYIEAYSLLEDVANSGANLFQDVVRKGTGGWKKVVAAFGNDILLENGEIDRARLGQIVFSDSTKRQLLNRYVLEVSCSLQTKGMRIRILNKGISLLEEYLFNIYFNASLITVDLVAASITFPVTLGIAEEQLNFMLMLMEK